MFAPNAVVVMQTDNPKFHGQTGVIAGVHASPTGDGMYYTVRTVAAPFGTVRMLPEELAAADVAVPDVPPPVAKRTEATGELCRKDGCGGMLARTGTCMTCQSCGDSTGGCS